MDMYDVDHVDFELRVLDVKGRTVFLYSFLAVTQHGDINFEVFTDAPLVDLSPTTGVRIEAKTVGYYRVHGGVSVSVAEHYFDDIKKFWTTVTVKSPGREDMLSMFSVLPVIDPVVLKAFGGAEAVCTA